MAPGTSPRRLAQGGAPRVGVEVVPRLEHPAVRVAPPRRSVRPRGARPRARPRRGCPSGSSRHRARGLARGVVELVARVEDVGEVAPRARLLGLEGERPPERPLGEREPARVGGGAELLHVRVAEPVVGPRVGRAPLEPALVGGDGAVGGAVVRPRAGPSVRLASAEERGRERDLRRRRRGRVDRPFVVACRRRSVPAPARPSSAPTPAGGARPASASGVSASRVRACLAAVQVARAPPVVRRREEGEDRVDAVRRSGASSRRRR